VEHLYQVTELVQIPAQQVLEWPFDGIAHTLLEDVRRLAPPRGVVCIVGTRLPGELNEVAVKLKLVGQLDKADGDLTELQPRATHPGRPIWLAQAWLRPVGRLSNQFPKPVIASRLPAGLGGHLTECLDWHI
jgi:hypothetical protein